MNRCSNSRGLDTSTSIPGAELVLMSGLGTSLYSETGFLSGQRLPAVSKFGSILSRLGAGLFEKWVSGGVRPRLPLSGVLPQRMRSTLSGNPRLPTPSY